MTSHERLLRAYEHREADRVPITDGPWSSTLQRWHAEGMPEGVSMAEYFGVDRVEGIFADTSPRYPTKVIEETDEYIVQTTSWGATLKNWKRHGGVPEFLAFTVTGPDSWAKAKALMTPSRDRVDWDRLQREYPKWKKDDAWIESHFWFGFDVTHSWFVGTDRLLFALVEDPEWVVDMFNHFLDMSIAQFEMVWDEGYRFDAITWPDDMGYRQNQFFSLAMYRELLKPVHARAAEWAHQKGLKVHLHSCGDIRPFVPELIEIGIDMLNPIEVKAGTDPVALKQQYGDRLAFHGGLNAVHFTEPERLWAEMAEVVPKMKAGGGYWLSSDHSVPDSVSLETFRQFVELGKKLGSFE